MFRGLPAQINAKVASLASLPVANPVAERFPRLSRKIEEEDYWSPTQQEVLRVGGEKTLWAFRQLVARVTI